MPNDEPIPSNDDAANPTGSDTTVPSLEEPSSSQPTPHPTAETSQKPTNSKGWDGKLRVPRSDLKPTITNPEALSDPEYSDEENVLPGEVVEADEDLVDESVFENGTITLLNLRISSIPALRLERFEGLRSLSLRQNRVKHIQLPESVQGTLEELELADNVIKHIEGLEGLKELTSLDLGYNVIKEVQGLESLTKLKMLYLQQNKISTIEGLQECKEVEELELGANRIRAIQNLENLTKLTNLYLAKNKITELRGLDHMRNLTTLDIQSNRIQRIENISHLENLEELMLADNLITSCAGLEKNTKLRTLDISRNPIQHLTGLAPLVNLQDLWASGCHLGKDESDEKGYSRQSIDRMFAEVEQELKGLNQLTEVYFEFTPLARDIMYKKKVQLALPGVRKIDANYVKITSA